MRLSRTVTMVDVHAEGEIGRVVTGGVIGVPGRTMLDKMRHINEVDDSLRRFLVYEPRGTAHMTVNLLLAPTRPEAQAGFIVLQADKAHAMSGSNAICVVTALLETGMVKMEEPETRVVLDTPAGLVAATAACRNGKCERVTLDMPASFAERLDVVLEVEGIGPVKADIAFGGVYYALVDVGQLGVGLSRGDARRLVELASPIKRAVNESVRVVHPEFAAINSVSYVMFCGRADEDAAILKSATIVLPGRLDRSPCGTGNAARLAARAARGEVRPGDRYKARSVIDSEFGVEFLGAATVGGKPAVLPRISGRGWIFGIHHVGVDPSDPYQRGFTLADMWGPDVHVTD